MSVLTSFHDGSEGARQRRALVAVGALLTALAGLMALVAGGSSWALAWTVLAVGLVVLRPHGTPAVFGFLAVLTAWTFAVSRPSAWAVVAAAALLGAHAALAAADATRDDVPLPPSALGRLAQRCLPVIALACLAGVTTSGHRITSQGTHILLGLAAFLLVAFWVGWLRRPAPIPPADGGR